jgi:hypothetical protein
VSASFPRSSTENCTGQCHDLFLIGDKLARHGTKEIGMNVSERLGVAFAYRSGVEAR